MNITIFAGKGGVGKSTSAAAYALGKSAYESVLLVDHDGGHSLPRVLALGENPKSNRIYKTGISNLDISIVDPIPFQSIGDAKTQATTTKDYLSQFKGDYGLLPFCDMITTFFGAPTDVTSVSKMATLVDLYHLANQKKVEHLIIDVEPTAGLERLLKTVDATSRSLQNLQKTGSVTLAVLGAKWPDIAHYLKSDYIRNADKYMQRLKEAADAIRKANYFIVSIPESSPIKQMEDVAQVIDNYGGNIRGYVLNNIRGEAHEAELIAHVHGKAKGKPVIEVAHDERLCESNTRSRRDALRKVGQLFE